MNKLIFILPFAIFSKIVLSQSSFDLGFGYCLYSNNYTDYKRIDGATLQFGYNYRLNDIFSLRTGFDANISRENYFQFHYDSWFDQLGDIVVDKTKIITDKTNSYSINIQIPVNFVTVLFGSKLSLYSGLCLGIDNLYILDSPYEGNDPEIGSPFEDPNDYYKKNWPISRKFCLGQQIGLLYNPCNRILFYFELKTLKNTEFSFSSLGLGLRYKITNR